MEVEPSEVDAKIINIMRLDTIDAFMEAVGRDDAKKFAEVIFDFPVLEDGKEYTIAGLMIKRIRDAIALEPVLNGPRSARLLPLKTEIHRILEHTDMARISSDNIRPMIQWIDAVEAQIDALFVNE